jgi:hypothetical protein
VRNRLLDKRHRHRWKSDIKMERKDEMSGLWSGLNSLSIGYNGEKY